MRAAVVTDFRAPLELPGLPVPAPGPGEVLGQADRRLLGIGAVLVVGANDAEVELDAPPTGLNSSLR